MSQKGRHERTDLKVVFFLSSTGFSAGGEGEKQCHVFDITHDIECVATAILYIVLG